jgi:hypothetical protein
MPVPSFINSKFDAALTTLESDFALGLASLEALRVAQREFRNARARRDRAARHKASGERDNREVEVAIVRLEILMEQVEPFISKLNGSANDVDNQIRAGSYTWAWTGAVAKHNVLATRELCHQLATLLHELRLQDLLPEVSRNGFESINASYDAATNHGRDFALMPEEESRTTGYPYRAPYLTYEEAQAYALQGILPNGTRQKSRVIKITRRNAGEF